MDLEPTAISRRIAQARKQAGYSQHRFANELGVHWRSVQNWERPDASVPWDRLPEIARLTEVKVEWLLGAQQTADVTGYEATRLREEMRVLREELLKELDHQRQFRQLRLGRDGRRHECHGEASMSSRRRSRVARCS